MFVACSPTLRMNTTSCIIKYAPSLIYDIVCPITTKHRLYIKAVKTANFHKKLVHNSPKTD